MTSSIEKATIDWSKFIDKHLTDKTLLEKEVIVNMIAKSLGLKT